MKGIVLAGGTGSRLYPITRGICKQLLPVYDKPLVYYPLSLLMLSDIRDILIITTSMFLGNFAKLLGNGKHLGLNICYKVQDEPKGISDALVIGEDFLGDDSVCLVLGDNILYGSELTTLFKKARNNIGATVFGYQVKNTKDFGIIEVKSGKGITIEEKPENAKSNLAVIGLYFMDNKAIKFSKENKPSKRGEKEITTILQKYIDLQELNVEQLGRGYAWLDAGTPKSLSDASNFISVLEERQGFKIACLEEIAYNMNFISKEQLIELSNRSNSEYNNYLKELCKN